MTAEERLEFLRTYGFLPISGGDGTDDEDDPEEEEDDEDDGGDDEDDSKNRKPASTKKVYSQADINRIVGQKTRSAKKKIADEIRAEITAELQKEKAKKDNDLEAQVKLLEKEVEDMPTLKRVVQRFSELAEQRYQDALDELPEHIRMMAPDEDADPITKETWLTEKALPAAKAFAKKNDKAEDDKSKKPATPGNKPRRPTGIDAVEVDEKKLAGLVDRFRRSGDFRPM